MKAIASTMQGSSGGRPKLILMGILGVAVGLRLALLGNNSLWFDEAFVVWVAKLPWPNIPPQGDFHPPLYYLLMKVWVGIFGAGETAIRMPSAGLSSLEVLLTYVLMRKISSASLALLSAFLVAVSPLQIMSGQEARMYPLLGVLGLASTLTLSMSIESQGVVRWSLYAVLAALMVYTHYLGFLVLLAHGLWVGCYERSGFGKWLASMGIVALLYLPWAPSLWYQLHHLRDWNRYGTNVPYRNLLDLIGLYVFGGSIFGMSSYFYAGTLEPVPETALLLPFVFLLWRGVASLSAERKTMGLIMFPLVVPAGLMFILSYKKPMFFPSWFSFLFPFFAMLIARGIDDSAQRFHSRRPWAMLALTAILVLSSAPTLTRYYLDPTFRPYQWRAAARWVQSQAEQGDFILYVGQATAISFQYYFHDRHPSLTLTPVEWISGANGGGRGFSTAQVRQLAMRYPRVWLVWDIAASRQTEQRLFPELSAAYQVVRYRDFFWTWIYLLRASS